MVANPDLEGHGPTDLARVDSSGQSLTVEFTDVSWTLETKDKVGKVSRRILKDLSGSIDAGKLTAIIGPSGCGKSTLMNVLSGRMAPDSVAHSTMTGAVSLNGALIDPVEYKQRFAYVMAEDSLFSTTTPREAFDFVSKLRLPHLSAEERRVRGDAMLETLGLTKCADTYIGNSMIKGISSGEKKRTSVGVELLPDPDVCFLDEPTTGLDSYTALELIRVTRKIADTGKTVLAVIHQPSSEIFDLFDDVICMSRGCILYQGPVATMTDYFATHGFRCPTDYNPSDYVMYVLQTITQDQLDTLAGAWTRRMKTVREAIVTKRQDKILHLKPLRRGPVLTQLAGLFKRELLRTVRDPSVLMVRFGITIMLGLLVGFLFFRVGQTVGPGDTISASHRGGLTNACIFAMMGSGQAMIISLPFDRPVILREYANGMYSVTAFVLSRLAVEFPLIFLQNIILAVLVYFLEAFSGNFMLFVLALFLLGAATCCTALMFGSSFKQVDRAVELSFILFVPQIMFSGFFVSINQIPEILRWAQWLCSIKYAVNISYIAEFKGLLNYEELFDQSSVDESLLWLYILILCLIVAVTTVSAIFLLRWRSKSVF